MSELTQAQARAAVYAQWDAQWPVLHPTVTYQKEGFFFKEPAPPAYWARVFMRHQRSGQETLGPKGARLYRRPAMIYVQLFGPINVGLNPLDLLAQDVKKIFEGEAFGGIDPAGGSDVREIGDDGRWYEVAVSVPVAYYELK